MTSLITIQKEVAKIKQAVLPKLHEYFEIVWMWPVNNHSDHGRYGMQIVTYDKSNLDAVDHRKPSEEEEIAMLKDYYDNHIPAHCKENPEHVWYTFEKYLKYYACKCGFHKIVEA